MVVGEPGGTGTSGRGLDLYQSPTIHSLRLEALSRRGPVSSGWVSHRAEGSLPCPCGPDPGTKPLIPTCLTGTPPGLSGRVAIRSRIRVSQMVPFSRVTRKSLDPQQDPDL